MEDYTAWESEPNEVSLKELKSICESLVTERELKSKLEDELKVVNEKIAGIEQKILFILKEEGIPNFKGDFGTVSIRTSKTVTQPENLEEKLKLFEYLKSQDLFEQMVSVNSRTLSSWASKEIEEKEKQGIFNWAPPGLKPAKEFQSLSIRKK